MVKHPLQPCHVPSQITILWMKYMLWHLPVRTQRPDIKRSCLWKFVNHIFRRLGDTSVNVCLCSHFFHFVPHQNYLFKYFSYIYTQWLNDELELLIRNLDKNIHDSVTFETCWFTCLSGYYGYTVPYPDPFQYLCLHHRTPTSVVGQCDSIFKQAKKKIYFFHKHEKN